MSEYFLRYFFFSALSEKKNHHYNTPGIRLFAHIRASPTNSLNFWSCKGRGVNVRKTWGCCRQTFIKLCMVTKKKTRKKKITLGKKKLPLFTKRSEWVRKKKYSREKKITAAQQKEWVSGSTIFSWEKKIRDLWLHRTHPVEIEPCYSLHQMTCWV